MEAASAPLISIVIPCYNQASFLGQSIESALAQTYVHREIIVVDDGSQDNTSEVAHRYDVQCLRQNNGGLSAARNTGLRLSRGQYLVFLDADDRLLPEALQAGYDCLQSHPDAAFGSGHYRYIREDGSLLLEYPQPPREADAYRALLKCNYIGMHATVMYRRSIFDEIGGFDPGLKSCEDYDVYLRIARHHRVASHRRMVAEYRMHEASMSVNAARMLRTGMRVLGSQWPYVGHSRARLRAYRDGIRELRRSAPQPLLNGMGSSLKRGDFSRAQVFSRGLAAYASPWLSALWLDLRLTARLAASRESQGES